PPPRRWPSRARGSYVPQGAARRHPDPDPDPERSEGEGEGEGSGHSHDRILRGDAHAGAPAKDTTLCPCRGEGVRSSQGQRAERDSLPRSERGFKGVRHSTPLLTQDDEAWAPDDGAA